MVLLWEGQCSSSCVLCGWGGGNMVGFGEMCRVPGFGGSSGHIPMRMAAFLSVFS